MKCPECGTKVALDDKICSSCGYPLQGNQKYKERKIKIGLAATVAVALLLAGIAVLTYQDAKPVTESIDAIGVVTLESEEKIQVAQSKLDHLNAVQKLFVTNKGVLEKARKTFEALPIELTPENARQYFDFNSIFTGLDDNDISVYSVGFFYHAATANMEVVCIPKQDKYYDGVRIVLEYDLGTAYNWTAPRIEITVGADGKGSRTEKIKYSGMIRPSLPGSNTKFMIVRASGNIYNRKPE